MLTTLLVIGLIIFFILSLTFIILFFTKTNCPTCPVCPTCPTCPACSTPSCIDDSTPVMSTSYPFGNYSYFLTSTGGCLAINNSSVFSAAIVNNTPYYIKPYYMKLFMAPSGTGTSICTIGSIGDIFGGSTPIPPTDGTTYLTVLVNQMTFEITWFPQGGQNNPTPMDIYLNGTLVTPTNQKNTFVDYTSPQSFDISITVGTNGLPQANMTTNY